MENSIKEHQLFLCELRRVSLAGTDHDRAQCSTMRLHVLKVAASVVVSARRLLVRLPRSFPFWELWRRAVSALALS